MESLILVLPWSFKHSGRTSFMGVAGFGNEPVVYGFGNVDRINLGCREKAKSVNAYGTTHLNLF